MILTELIWPWRLTLGYLPTMGKTAKLMTSGLRRESQARLLDQRLAVGSNGVTLAVQPRMPVTSTLLDQAPVTSSGNSSP